MLAVTPDPFERALRSALRVRREGGVVVIELRPGEQLLSRAEVTVDADAACATLGAVFTAPELRRRGHARTLVLEVTRALPLLGVRSARLTCQPELQALYASAGWRVEAGDTMVIDFG